MSKLLLDLQQQLNHDFKRTKADRWSYAEEFALAEVCRRQNVVAELTELRAYRKKNPGFYPRSIHALLEEWQKHLDVARNFVPVGQNGQPKKESLLMKLAREV